MGDLSTLSSKEVEAANRAEATALLIRAGYRVYRPEADCYGEDLVVRTPSGGLLPVQLKSRPTGTEPARSGCCSVAGLSIPTESRRGGHAP